MKIWKKLIFSFLMITILISIAGYVSIRISQNALEGCIGRNSVLLAVETLDKIDRSIYNRIEEFQAYSKDLMLREFVVKSNREFEGLEDVRGYIAERDREWVFAPKDEVTPFMRRIIDNRLSLELREKIYFYEEKEGYKVYGEVFVTNKYGVNIAQTGKTSDYYQADEKWWQAAKEEGLFVRDVGYDESAGIYSIDIGIRVDGEEGNFIGVIKAALNIKGMIDILRELEPGEVSGGDEHSGESGGLALEFDLIDREGKILYSGEEFKFFESVSDDLMERFSTHHSKKYFIAPGDKSHEGEELYAYAHSRGYKDFKGLGWILMVDKETKEIFTPVVRLRNNLLVISAVVAVLAVLLGLFIARSISGPLEELGAKAVEIGGGRFDVRADIRSKDEIGFLAGAFNEMAKRIGRLVEKEKHFAAVAAAAETERKRADELEEAYGKLKEMQEIVIQAEKLNAIGQLASGVAHEVKNPLAVILQGVDYLEIEIPKEGGMHNVLDLIRKSVMRADNIVRGLVDFSRVTQLDIRKEDINSVLNTALDLTHGEVMTESVEVFRELGKDLPAVSVDRLKMEQVFVNILLNAVHAMADGGKIFVRSYLHRLDKPGEGVGEREEDDFRIDEEVVRIEIEDTGIGIPEKNLKKIFNPFFTTKKIGKGTGLGLAVTRNIVIMHKGRLKVESVEGKGAKFIIDLKPA